MNSFTRPIAHPISPSLVNFVRSFIYSWSGWFSQPVSQPVSQSVSLAFAHVITLPAQVMPFLVPSILFSCRFMSHHHVIQPFRHSTVYSFELRAHQTTSAIFHPSIPMFSSFLLLFLFLSCFLYVPLLDLNFRSSCSFVLPDMFQILEVILDPFHLSRISSMFLFLLPPQLKTAKSWAKFPRKGRNRNRIGNHCACFFGNHEKLRNFRKILGKTKSWKQKK